MEVVLSYAMRKYLDEAFPEISRAVLIEDGISLTNVPKPFVTIEYLGSNDEELSAGRTSYEEIHRYQVGIFTRSLGERAQLSTQLKDLLRVPSGIPEYTMQTGLPTGGSIQVGISEFTPMPAADSSNETFKHYGYFIAEIEILRNAGESTFTQ